MKGFDPKFRDFPDYIIGITKEIWEDRGLATLNHYYAPDIVVRMPGSVSTGNQGVIEATAATLAEFPDRTLLGEDVIWSGTPEEGMLSSHRILSTATHLGDGGFGKATGKKLVYRILADCHAKNNSIDDEWLVRDNGAVVRQMGWDPKDFARDLIIREGGPTSCVKPLSPANDIAGPYEGTGNNNEWGQRHADLINRLMNSDIAVIEHEYDRAVQTEYPGGVTGHGRSPVENFWMNVRTAMPSAQFTIHHQIGRSDTNMPLRSAIRWSLHGKHDGSGYFGAPTGADIYILGISHAEWGELIGGQVTLRREWTLFDETAIWKQILLHSGDL